MTCAEAGKVDASFIAEGFAAGVDGAAVVAAQEVAGEAGGFVMAEAVGAGEAEGGAAEAKAAVAVGFELRAGDGGGLGHGGELSTGGAGVCVFAQDDGARSARPSGNETLPEVRFQRGKRRVATGCTLGPG